MEIITSKDNALVKHIVKLGEKKYRDEFCEYVAEGGRWVSDAAACGAEISKVVVSQSRFERGDLRYDLPVTVFSDNVFAKVSATESSQGILAVIKKPQAYSLPSGRLALYLDRVRDPGNLGTIIRTAAAAGFGDIVLNSCADPFGAKAVRASMTALLSVRFVSATVQELRGDGYCLLCADMGGENAFDVTFDRGAKYCLVIGNEANGVSGDINAVCDRVVALPMTGAVESLNAAVSAGVLMYLIAAGK